MPLLEIDSFFEFFSGLSRMRLNFLEKYSLCVYFSMINESAARACREDICCSIFKADDKRRLVLQRIQIPISSDA